MRQEVKKQTWDVYGAMGTEIKTKSQLTYIKKKIENKSEVKIQQIRQEVSSLRYYEVNFIKFKVTINEQELYVVVPAFINRRRLNKEIQGVVELIKKKKEYNIVEHIGDDEDE